MVLGTGIFPNIYIHPIYYLRSMTCTGILGMRDLQISVHVQTGGVDQTDAGLLMLLWNFLLAGSEGVFGIRRRGFINDSFRFCWALFSLLLFCF